MEDGGGQAMWHKLWRWEAQTAICWGNLREGDEEDEYLDGNVILKIDVIDIFRVGVYWIDVAQGRHKWRADVNRVMKLRVP